MTSISTIAMWQRKKRHSVTPIVVSSYYHETKPRNLEDDITYRNNFGAVCQ
ncbi:hypothetical protein KIN20_025149 [Parelaphostrongylus tenuis]|uniref:Uncharacterized protein n=1 Tax=Parelaphostrongylus tenuis TaxID=148309 RepID=A0AAD5MUS6_PARTN|nr:hypothetical protein KIN20_025149 [Parelaphostrongylus tenuis]